MSVNLDLNGYVTIWRLMPSGRWIIERSYALHYAKYLLIEYNNPSLAIFPRNFNPNDLV